MITFIEALNIGPGTRIRLVHECGQDVSYVTVKNVTWRSHVVSAGYKVVFEDTHGSEWQITSADIQTAEIVPQ